MDVVAVIAAYVISNQYSTVCNILQGQFSHVLSKAYTFYVSTALVGVRCLIFFLNHLAMLYVQDFVSVMSRGGTGSDTTQPDPDSCRIWAIIGYA